MMIESKFHKHAKGCRVSLDKLFAPLPPGKVNNYAYFYEVADDGRLFSRLNGRYALEGCYEMRIPIFLPGRPEGLP